MKKNLKKLIAVAAVMVMCLAMFSCGSSKQKDETKETTTEPVETTQVFKTKDGKYQITVGSGWNESDPYTNDDSSLELEIGFTMIQIMTQPNSEVAGYSLSEFSDEVTGYVIEDETLGKSTVEKTEDVTCGNYKGIRKTIVTDDSNGMKYIIYHVSIKTDTDHMQFIVMSTESNRETALKYCDEITQTITPL